MPEVLTKHPVIVKEVLQSAGARCGAGAPQKILKDCPPAAFCALPGGEICVFGPKELKLMTQLSREDVCEIRADAGPPAGGTLAASSGAWGIAPIVPVLALGAALLLRRCAR